MILLRCHIRGFGKLSDLQIDFGRAFNLVFAANEGGKSTLLHFLLAMLYGQLRADMKHQRRFEPWADQYKPWRGADYGGILWCELVRGRILEVHRTFGKDEYATEVRSATGEDVTSRFEHQKNGEVLFAKTHLGIQKDLFESIAVIRENKASEIDGASSIRDRIANLAQTGNESQPLRLSLQRLETALEAIGTERATSKPFRQSQDRLAALRDERDALENRRREVQDWIQERDALEKVLARIETEHARANAGTRVAQWRETRQVVETLTKIQARSEAVRSDIESLGGDRTFPTDRLDELNHLAGGKGSLDQRLTEIRELLPAALERLRQAEAAKNEFSAYGELEARQQADSPALWLVGYKGLSEQIAEIERAIERLTQEGASVEQAYQGMKSVFHDSSVDWHERAKHAAIAQHEASEKSIELAGKIAIKKTTLQDFVRSARWGAIVSTLFLAAAGLAMFAPGRFTIASAILRNFLYVAGAVLAVLAVIVSSRVLRFRRSARRIRLEMDTLQLDEARYREKEKSAYTEIQPHMNSAGILTLEEFLSAARRAEQLRGRMSELKSRMEEARARKTKLSADRDEAYARLEACLREVGLPCSPESLETQVEKFRHNLKDFQTAESHLQKCSHEVESLRKEEARGAEESVEIEARIARILSEGGVSSIEEFQERCRTRRRVLALLAEESALSRECETLLAGQSESQWRERLRNAEVQLPDPVPEDLPFWTLEEAAKEEKRLFELLARDREEYARMGERVRQAFQNFRPLSEIEEDLAWEEGHFANLEVNRNALKRALDALKDASEEQQELLAPQLNQAVERRFHRLSRSRYKEVRIEPGFQAWVREIDTGELRSAENLSRGTKDQLYFALRFGILDLVSGGDESAPCFLDEPFDAYDNDRMSEAFKILDEEATRRQLILFTCREDVRDLAVGHGAHLVELGIKEPVSGIKD